MYDEFFGGLEIWLVLGWLASVAIRCVVYKQPLYTGSGLPQRAAKPADIEPGRKAA